MFVSTRSDSRTAIYYLKLSNPSSTQALSHYKEAIVIGHINIFEAMLTDKCEIRNKKNVSMDLQGLSS